MTYQDIIKILQKYDHHFDDTQLNKAVKFLLKYEHNYKHLLEISETLVSIYPDTKSVITCLLFFSSVKQNLKLTYIKHHCDEEVAAIFFSLAKLFRIQNTYYNTTPETFQLFLSLKPHLIIRVLLIRFAYLLHKIIFNCTISDIEYYLMSNEIKDIYVSLFKEITVEKINNALQNVCLEILQPQLYKFITDFLKVNYQNPNQLVIKVINSFHDILSRLDLAYTISGRVKSTYSIAQKLVNKSNKIKNLFDIIGIRIIVEQNNECYKVLNTILRNYTHIPNKNKDFIKFPKKNNYQSLHTVIIYQGLHKLEVQIRTSRMHNIAQFGSASHLQYKINLQNSNNIDIAYNILNKFIFNTLNQYIPTILHQYFSRNRLDGFISYIIGLIKPDYRTLKQDVFIDHENAPYYWYKSTIYIEYSIDLDLDIKHSIDRLQSSPNISVMRKISHQVLFSTNYHCKHAVISNCQKYNVEILGRQVIQWGETTHTVGQLPSEQMEYNLPVSNSSALKQTVPIVNIIHTSKHLISEDLLQCNVGKCAQQKRHPDVDSKNFKINSGTTLLVAIDLQDADMVELLLTHPNISIKERGMCIAQSTSIKDGDLPFLLAVHNGNLEIVEKLLAYPKLDIYQINHNKEHALIIATQLGNIEILRLLINYLDKKFQDNIEEFGRYLNLTNSEGQSALYFAFDYFQLDPCISIEMIRILLSIIGQDGDSLVQDSQTIDITAELHEIFFQEILNGNRQTVEALMTITQNHKLVIDVNKSNMTDEYSGTALLMAIDLQDADMVELLLTHPNISIKERGMCIAQSTSIKDGDLPFLLAVHNGNLEIVEKLLAYPKLDIYQINHNKEHALIIATQLGNIEILRLLINYLDKKFQDNIEEFGRYLNLTNSEGQSALYFAFDYFQLDPCISIEMIRILLSIIGQDGDSLVQDSQTIDITAELHEIFFQEILNGNRQTVEALMTITQNHKLVIDVNKSNMTDEYSGTALLMAIDLQDADMVELLLTHPNISIKERGMCIAQSTSIKDGDLPFLLAVHNGNLEIVEKLLAYPKLDIYQINHNKEHALIIATQLGNIEILRLLINYLDKKFQDNIEEFGRYLNLTNSEGQSALYFAFDYFQLDPCISIEMIRILLSITGQDGDSLVQDSQTIDITAELHKIFFQEILNGNRQTVEALMTITQNHKLVIDVNKSNMTDEYSGTALLMAIDLQDADMVELLLTHPNIDLNRSFTYHRDANINGDIYTVHPFLEALSSNDRIIHLFLKDFDKNKIDILEVDKHGQVCVDNSNEIIIKRNQNSESALMIAIQYGDIDILRRLINALKIKLTNDHFKQYLNYVEPFEGNNVLTLAGRQGNKVIVQALIGLKGEDGVPLININHQDFFGNRVQHYFTDDKEIQYEFRQYATQDLSTKTLKNIITNPQSTHYADEEVKKCIAALQSQFQDQLTEQHIGQSVEAIHNYLDKLQNDRIFCLDSFGHSTISIQCRATTNVESVSRNISVEIVPKVVKHLLQGFDGTMREVMHLAWLMIKYREKTDNSQNFNFTIDLIKNLTQAAFEYTKDDVKELNVETMKQACSKGICTVLISCAMPTVRLVNYDEGEKAPGYFAQNPERVREYLQTTTEYIQCEIFTAEFKDKWQKMLNEFCPNPTNDDKIVWDNELNKLNVILDQSEFLDIWSDIMGIIKDLMNNENNWNPSNITQILKKQYSNVIMIHQKIENFLQEQPQLLQTIKNSELYPIRQLVSNNQDCDVIANIMFMFVVHNADIEMAQSLIEYKNKDGTPLIQAEYTEMAEDESEQDHGIEKEYYVMLQVFLLVEYLYAQNVNQDKAKQLLMLKKNNKETLIDTQAADVILQYVHDYGGSVPEPAEESIIHENLGTYTEHTHLLGDV